jgi:subtilase family serine protease
MRLGNSMVPKIFKRSLRTRSAIVLFVAFLGILGVLAATSPSKAAASAAATAPVSLKASAAPRVPAGALRVGALAPNAQVHVDVTLNLPDQAALTSFLNGLANPQSPYFHHFLQPGQFGARFGPSLQQVAAVAKALKAAGLSPGQVTSNRLAIPVTASAAAIEHAFGITLDQYRLPGGRVAFANSAAPKLPAAVAPLVQGVLGLNDLYPAQPLDSPRPLADAPRPLTHSARPLTRASGKGIPAVKPTASGPQPCQDATTAAILAGSNTIDAFAEYYLMSPLYNLGDLGKGARIGILELEPNLPSDVSAYEACYGISTPVNYIEVDGGAGSGAGSGEAALDIDVVAGLSPDSTIDVYQAPNSNGAGPGTGIYDIFNKFATTDTDKVMSVSWGSCEAETSASDMEAEEALFEQANAQGQTILAAAGDNGSTDCFNLNTGDTNDTLSVNFPASAPYVVSVGGTSVTNVGEVAWNESELEAGAGGGGISGWCMPGYQYQTAIPGLVNSLSQTTSACDSSNPKGLLREVPDISADADPFSGYTIYYDGGWEGGIGGTSAATPLWAAIAALTDASPFCADYDSGNPGVLPQGLYAMASTYHSYLYGSTPEVLGDITSGNNDYTVSGYTGGLYPATEGFDMATGLGVPLVSGISGSNISTFYPGYTALMCREFAKKLTSVKVTSVSPSAGPSGKKATVTVHGSGFLPISGADVASVVSGSKVIATVGATCKTTTACTVTLPAESARTVDVVIVAEDFWGSARTSADHFQYANAPHVSSISPTKGTHKGGTKITIHGTNFIDVQSVHFGGKAGTKVKVVSATEITVVTPAEKGTVKVTVTAAGGTSNSVTYKFT